MTMYREASISLVSIKRPFGSSGELAGRVARDAEDGVLGRGDGRGERADICDVAVECGHVEVRRPSVGEPYSGAMSAGSSIPPKPGERSPEPCADALCTRACRHHCGNLEA